eukprot:7000840-Prymnesium_polylepis.1
MGTLAAPATRAAVVAALEHAGPMIALTPASSKALCERYNAPVKPMVLSHLLSKNVIMSCT